jgi:hypothetical protein
MVNGWVPGTQRTIDTYLSNRKIYFGPSMLSINSFKLGVIIQLFTPLKLLTNHGIRKSMYSKTTIGL